MSPSLTPMAARKTATPAGVTDAPAWALRLVGRSDAMPVATGDAAALATSADGRWSLVRAVVQDAEAMDGPSLRRATARAYTDALALVADTAAPHPVRAWNAVPAIHRPCPTGGDRYMAFNAGRHDAYQRWLGDADAMAHTMPTASAIGHVGPHLVVHLLTRHRPGTALENPRQVPAFRYSARYGKVPPSFVRATALREAHGRIRLLVAGTASVVGEDSRHAGDLPRQLDETCRNLAAIVHAARGWRGMGQGSDDGAAAEATDAALACYESLRVYVRRARDVPAVLSAVRGRMPRAGDLECVRADICRPELLVEVEGVALLPAGGDKPVEATQA